MNLLADLLNLLSPRFCPMCGQPLTPSDQLVCTGCLVLLPYTRWTDHVINPASQLLLAHLPLAKATSYLFYRDAVHQLVHQLKYGHRPDIGYHMGRFMALELQPTGFFQGIEGIVPVPLHRWRHWQRGYNQSSQLARGIASVTRIPVLKRVVKRLRNNPSQTALDANERQENVANLFLARPTPYRHVLLIDDVLTTGSTLCACGKAILRSNPTMQFSILTLAKA